MTPYVTILNSVQSVIAALAITSLTATVRKRLFIKELDALPVAIIVPGKPEIDDELTENTIIWKRPVFIGIATATGDGKLESSFDLADAEERIRQALHKPSLSGASTVFDADVDPTPLFIESATDDGYDLTIIRVDYLSTESRSV